MDYLANFEIWERCLAKNNFKSVVNFFTSSNLSSGRSIVILKSGLFAIRRFWKFYEPRKPKKGFVCPSFGLFNEKRLSVRADFMAQEPTKLLWLKLGITILNGYIQVQDRYAMMIANLRGGDNN